MRSIFPGVPAFVLVLAAVASVGCDKKKVEPAPEPSATSSITTTTTDAAAATTADAAAAEMADAGK